MEINIMDYVSESEIKESILSAVKEKVYNMKSEDIQRIYTNACYTAVTQYSNEIIKEKGLDFSIEEKVKEIIRNLSAFTVFYHGTYGDKNSEAFNLTQQIVKEEKEALREVIKENLHKAYSAHEASTDLAQLMADSVFDIFSIKKD